MTDYTPEQLNARLLAISTDPAWDGPFRGFANCAVRDRAAEYGFAIEPADLSDGEIQQAMRQAIFARADRFSTKEDQ